MSPDGSHIAVIHLQPSEVLLMGPSGEDPRRVVDGKPNGRFSTSPGRQVERGSLTNGRSLMRKDQPSLLKAAMWRAVRLRRSCRMDIC